MGEPHDDRTEEKRLNVFLAHSSGDKPYIREMHRLLKLDGFNPWLDEKNLVAGQNWELEVEKAVDVADAIAVFLSSKALDNAGYLHKEIGFALDAAERLPEGAIKLIPIRLDQHEVPRRLRHLHWIDSDRTQFEPRFSKGMHFDLSKLPILRQFSIGNRYLQLQRALIVLRRGFDPWNLDVRGEDGKEQMTEFIVRGQNEDGTRYYGRAAMRVVIEEEWHKKVTLNSSIEGADYSYGGDLFDTDIDLDGAHEVHYCISGGALAVGTWGSGGLEESISTHTNHSPPFGRW